MYSYRCRLNFSGVTYPRSKGSQSAALSLNTLGTPSKSEGAFGEGSFLAMPILTRKPSVSRLAIVLATAATLASLPLTDAQGHIPGPVEGQEPETGVPIGNPVSAPIVTSIEEVDLSPEELVRMSTPWQGVRRFVSLEDRVLSAPRIGSINSQAGACWAQSRL